MIMDDSNTSDTSDSVDPNSNSALIIVYTDKERALHIHGEKSIIPTFPRYDIIPSFISHQEITEFYENGYFCVERCVSSISVHDARKYIDMNYKRWLNVSKRQDDWRIFHNINLLDPLQEVDHIPILNLLISSPDIMTRLTSLLGAQPSGIFYTQIAFRTPVKKAQIFEDYNEGAEYHLDGNINHLGIRFPDPWTVMVGIALVDIQTDLLGNFTVFPKSHVSRNWSTYPLEKQSKTIPLLSNPTRLKLKAGDAVFVHVLLAHRGGKNTYHSKESAFESSPDDYLPISIPMNTREMIFFRIQADGIDYVSPDRASHVLNNPWYEFQYVLKSHGINANELNDVSPT